MKISAAALLALTVVSPAVDGFTTRTSSLRTVTTQQQSSSLWAKPKVFIDGEAGTTGIQVFDRLNKREDLEVISSTYELRRDEATRKRLINEADAVILCKWRSVAA